jgi:hypothetical protein
MYCFKINNGITNQKKRIRFYRSISLKKKLLGALFQINIYAVVEKILPMGLKKMMHKLSS